MNAKTVEAEVMEQRLSELVEALPTTWLENYVETYEAGRVQEHPHARFVNAKGECCLVGALAAAGDARAVVGSALWARFPGTELEELSRRFEARRLSGQDVYEEALLALATRRRPRERSVTAIPGRLALEV